MSEKPSASDFLESFSSPCSLPSSTTCPSPPYPRPDNPGSSLPAVTSATATDSSHDGCDPFHLHGGGDEEYDSDDEAEGDDTDGMNQDTGDEDDDGVDDDEETDDE